MSTTVDLPEPETNAVASKPADANGAGKPTKPADSIPNRKSRRRRWLIVSILSIGVLVWIGHFIYHAYLYQETDDAYVGGHLHQISSQVDGRVQEVLVDDNQEVKAGAILIRLDPLEYEIGLQKAQATVAQAKARVAEAVADASRAGAQLAQTAALIAQAEAQVRQTGAQLELARRNHARNVQLFQDNGVIAKSELDASQSVLAARLADNDAATANLNAAKAGEASAKAAQESAQAQEAAAQAMIAGGEADGNEAKRKLARTTLAAPADGRIGNKNVEVGNRVQAGETLLALVEPDVWVVANFKETQLSRMHRGQTVDVTIDALPGEILPGTVDSLAPASGAQFALLPADNATGNFTKVVQRVPVKIVFAPETTRRLADKLRPGLSAVVSVRVR
ncbi:MAG: Secretion protein HlyD family protein [Pedosphaera sp.]|nr:Secretion protein HlyD family protein [Pedosphaera sp.]